MPCSSLKYMLALLVVLAGLGLLLVLSAFVFAM